MKINTLWQAALQWQRARRRERNRRIGARSQPVRAPRLGAGGVGLVGVAALALIVAGGAVIALHARHLVEAEAPMINPVHTSGMPTTLNEFQPALPGLAFTVPETASLNLATQPGGVLAMASGMRAAPVRVDLCSQMLDPAKARLLPLRVGYRFGEVTRWVQRNEAAAAPVALRNVLMAAPDSGAMPEVEIDGSAHADFGQPLQLSWHGDARWISDAGFGQIAKGEQGQGDFYREAWLVWEPQRALRVQRRATASCPQAGELVFQLFDKTAEPGAKAVVTAFPAYGSAVSMTLPAGAYRVPAAPGNRIEDETLFRDLQARGLVRLDAGGLIDLVPRDLPNWRASPATARAGELANWDAVQLDRPTLKLIKHLYAMADGDYVRQQIHIFNSERQLLAWRVGAGPLDGEWEATAAAAPVATTTSMPPGASRLFAALPQGWGAWTRVAQWPAYATGEAMRLRLALPQAAVGGELLHLMLIGRAGNIEGAQLRGAAQPACTGRACTAPNAVQTLTLELQPGARSVALSVQPLAWSNASDDAYRHLRVAGGQLSWHALQVDGAAPARRPQPPATTALADRNGLPLWSDGAPTKAAVDAGLAPLLGLRADHTNSVAGMLARLPVPPVTARLSLDLNMQTVSQHALDCIGMHRGRWDGAHCSGGETVPEGRHAGLVIIDTETGDVLAAAGVGMASVTAANWSEVRDFDRTDPARSPLRLPALQHDGGAHSSPGSTFKIISALGLEAAAKHDPQLDSLLEGMPLPAINRIARQHNFSFETDAATYPLDTRHVHITNFKDQHLDRHAQDGRFGLAQALTYSLNTWFAWTSELSDRSLFSRPDGGAPDLQPLEAGALDTIRPIVGMAHRLGFEQPLRLDGGLLPADYAWSQWDALQASAAHIDPIHSRHELRQMAIGLRMQVTPLQMALAAGAVGQGKVIAPRMLLALDGQQSAVPAMADLGVRLDRIRAGMKGVIDSGTGAGAFRAKALDHLRAGLYGKTGTAPTGEDGDSATVWFSGWLEPGSLPGQRHRLAVAAFVSHSPATGGEHAAPIVAAVFAALAAQNPEQKGK